MMKPIDPNDILRRSGADALRDALDNADDPFASEQVGPNGSDNHYSPHVDQPSLKVWNAGRDIGDLTKLPPKQFLLATVFCRANTSMLVGVGAAGKTSVRIAQYLALASGRNLTGEHVFKRGRVLLLSFEDDIIELKRRIGAAMKHYEIADHAVDGWLYFAALSRKDGKIAVRGADDKVVLGDLAGQLANLIGRLQLDMLGFDPLVKCHALDENSNNDMGAVMEILTNMAKEYNIATDLIAHNNKVLSEPGDANRLRGASAQKDAARLVYTLTTMSHEEAQQFGISEVDRPSYVRMDRANADLSDSTLNAILDEIERGVDGKRYSAAAAAKGRAAWKIVVKLRA